MPFTPPTEKTRLAAVGDLSKLKPDDKLLLTKSVETHFKKMGRPKKGSWLAERKESGQDVRRFGRVSMKSVPHSMYKTLYLQPFGDFPVERSPDLKLLAELAAKFFGTNCQVLPGVELAKVSQNLREGYEGQAQIKTGDVTNYLRTMKKPRDCFAIVGVTMVDLYPRDAYNFVFGIASSADGVGVYSFARYDPSDEFLVNYPVGGGASKEPIIKPLTDAERSFQLYRCLKVFAHESCHILGMKHCVFYKCLMNGSNHIDEFDSKNLLLCPVCLHKLAIATKTTLADRYEALASAYRKQGWVKDAEAIEQRLAVTKPSARAVGGPPGGGGGGGGGGRATRGPERRRGASSPRRWTP